MCSQTCITTHRPVYAQAGKGNGAAPSTQGGQKFDYDLVIIGAGVGGHGAALHAVESVSQRRIDPNLLAGIVCAVSLSPHRSGRALRFHS